MALLEVKGLTVGYGARAVLKELSLTLEPGEMLGVIGPNGCGKSTLIKTISVLLKPAAGSIKVEGLELARMKPEARARLLGVVPQNPALPETFTAAEVVMFGRTPYLGLFQNESPNDWAIVERAMRDTDCWEMAETYIGEMSGGERQRVLLAMALAQEPRLLLLDEPTTFLDINYQIETMEVVKSWKTAGEPDKPRAILAVFHELNLAAQYCDRLALMSQGRVLVIGKPGEVITTENILRAYGAHVIVMPHPQNQLPTTFIMPNS